MDRSAEALKVARKYTAYATAAGMVPILGVDLAAVAALQVKMIKEIAAVYGVPFEAGRTRTIVMAVLGSFTAFSHGVPGWIVARYSLLGLVGTVLKPAYAWLVTYGIAHLFVMHFERGGTLEDFNPLGPEVQDGMRAAFDQARDWVTGTRGQVSPAV